MKTVALLFVSNIFMTFAWYGHLRNPGQPLIRAILVSWGIAFFEYCLTVPANRMGYGNFTVSQLKVLQEAITLIVFSVFAVLYLKEKLHWNHAVAFLFLILAVWFAFRKA